MASTSICTSDLTSITVRGRDLVNDLVGELTFTEMLYFLSCGRKPDERRKEVTARALEVHAPPIGSEAAIRESE